MKVFFAELSNESVQAGAKVFNEFADNPLFIEANSI